MRVRAISLAALLGVAAGCGGSNKLASNSGISGAYEFVVISNVTGGVTLVETNLAANGNQSGASGPSRVQILTLEKKTWYVNGVCPGANPGQNSVAATFGDNSVALTFNEGGNTTPGQGMLSGGVVTGNYAVSGSSCPDLIGEVGFPPGTDSGGFVGTQVPALAGTFSGALSLPDGVDNAAFTLTENPDFTLAVSVVLTGAVDNGTFAFTGSAVGNILSVAGSVNGQTLSLLGYYDRTGTFTGMPNTILVFNHSTLAKAGLLIAQ